MEKISVRMEKNSRHFMFFISFFLCFECDILFIIRDARDSTEYSRKFSLKLNSLSLSLSLSLFHIDYVVELFFMYPSPLMVMVAVIIAQLRQRANKQCLEEWE